MQTKKIRIDAETGETFDQPTTFALSAEALFVARASVRAALEPGMPEDRREEYLIAAARALAQAEAIDD